ncbi:MAG: triple tyrosine motif-containing protein [Halioglobus sp.]
METENSHIFLVTRDQGILSYNAATDSFGKISSQGNKLPYTQISTALVIDGTSLLISYQNGETFRLSTTSNNVEKIPLSDFATPTSFTQSAFGPIYFSSDQGSIYKMESSDSTPKKIIENRTCSKLPLRISYIASVGADEIWIGTHGAGLFQLNLSDLTCVPVALPEQKGYKYNESSVFGILHDGLRELTWVGTDQGLYVINDIGKVQHFHEGNSDLKNNEVTALEIGLSNTIWIGTYTGLNLAVEPQFEKFDSNNEINLRSVVGFDEWHDGSTVIATYDGVIFHDASSDSFKDLDRFVPGSALKNSRIMALSVGSENLWVGYSSTGLERHLIGSNELEVYNTNSTKRLPSNAVSAILEFDSDTTIIGTYGGGISVISNDPSKTHSIVLDRSNSSLKNSVISLFKDHSNKIWIGTESGLYQHDINGNVFTELSELIVNSKWPQHRVVFSMRESITGDLWLGTSHDGLYHLSLSQADPNKFEIVDVFLTDGAYDGTVYAVEIDDQNLVWASTNQGLFRIDPAKDSIIRYTTSHGLISSEFDFGASFKDSKGRLYFGGSNGYNRFHPSDINLDVNPPTVVLTDISIAGKRPVLPVALHDLELIELAHKDYFITLFFSALDYLDPEKNQFSYKLDNFDPEWIDNQTRHSATYTNLPSGEYVFRVRGANSAGVWNMEGASVRIRVLPPWWFTWWAYSVYACLLTVLAYYSKRSYDRRVIYKKATAMAEEMRRVADTANDDLQEQLEDQDKLLNNVYVHNLSTLALVKRILTSAEDIPDTAEAFSSTQRRIDVLTLLEECVFYHGDTIYADMEKCTNLIISRSLMTATVAAESITTINEIGRNAAPIETATVLAAIIFELVENCMQHAFEPHSPSNFVHITLESNYREETQSEEITLKVKDNGVGIPDSILANSFDTHGFAIIRALAESFEGSLDLSSSDGTLACVTLPSSPALLPPMGTATPFDA